jgi:RNA polymerase sigma factor (sigma-70 family)
VWGVVVHLMHRSDVQALGEDEAVAIGNFTLFRCAQGFRPELGYTFSTYASKPIARSIINAAEKLAKQPRPSALDYDVPAASQRDDDNPLAVALPALPEQLQSIVRLRFGLDSGKPMSYTKLATELGISATAARSRVERALDRMREVV